MASLETLPAPLPLNIIVHLSDLKSLDALRRSSPLCAAVFRLHAAEILEDLMQRTLSTDVIVELRAYILLRTRTSRPQTEGLLDSLYADAQEPLDRTTPFTVIGYALREFTTLACTCNTLFHTKLERLYSLPHEHFAETSMMFWGRPGDTLCRKPYGSPYTIPDPSPPRWDEEQRMLRAIWRLRLFSMLGRPKAFPAFRQSARQNQPYIADEIEEMAVSLVGVDYSSDGLPKICLTTWEALATFPSPYSEAAEALRDNRESIDDLIRSALVRPPGYSFFHVVCLRRPHSPLKGADWTVLRRLGLGIWSAQRLAELELASPRYWDPSQGSGAFRHQENRMFTWNVLYLAELASGAAGKNGS